MGSRADTEMDRWAETVANRDDAPFPRINDSIIFVPDSLAAGSPGHYEARRTGGEGIATPEEFAAAFYGDPRELARDIPGYEHQPGTVVTGFSTHIRQLIKGEVAAPPFFTVRRTPDLYSMGQTTGRPGESREYNLRGIKCNTYVGSLWLAIDYSFETEQLRTHVPLFTVSRDAGHELTRKSGALPQLVFGAEAVAVALAGRVARGR